MSNKDVVAALYSAFAKRDPAVVGALSDAGLVITQTELLPRGGTYRGHDGLKAFTGKLLGHVDSQVTIEEYVEAGVRVAPGRTKGTVRGDECPVRRPRRSRLDDAGTGRPSGSSRASTRVAC